MGALFKIAVIVILLFIVGLIGFVVLNVLKIFEFIENFSHGYFVCGEVPKWLLL